MENTKHRMKPKTRNISRDILATIKAVQVEYCGRVPKGYTEEMQQYIESWIYGLEQLTIDQQRIDDELLWADFSISELEAIQRAVVEIGYINWLDSLDYDADYGVALSVISEALKKKG